MLYNLIERMILMDTKQEEEKVYISDDTIQMIASLLFKRGYDKDYVERTVCNLLNVNVILNKYYEECNKK